jgi:hypothetical protein
MRALQMGLLDTLLRTEWDDRKDAGLFRYDVASCPSMMVPGTFGFIAQLNEGRASKKRPTEFRVDQVRLAPAHLETWRCACVPCPTDADDTCAIHVCIVWDHAAGRRSWPSAEHVRGRAVQVAQAFDMAKFNFTKALQKEVLVQFEPTLEKQPAYETKVPNSRDVHRSSCLIGWLHAVRPGNGTADSPSCRTQATVHGSPNLVYINVSPIEYGHVLLVPRVMDCLPQVRASL